MNTPGPAMPWEADDAISQRAADYFQRRHFWEWTDADEAELEAWFAEAASHRVAYLRVKGIVAYTEHLAAVHTFKIGPMSSPAASHGNGKAVRLWFALPLLAAASIALMATLAIPFVRDLMQPPDRIFATNVGGQALLKFADGTEVELNTDTAVRYRMTTQERTIWLDKGEAYFRVAHNAADPFAVVAGGHRITDLGTEFLVRETGNLDVVLVKGRAQLTSKIPGAPVAMLVPGDEAVATPSSTTITQKTRQQLADALSWRRGVLEFRNTRLADAVQEFNRYNEIKLVIADPSIAGVKFSAEARTTDYVDFLKLVQTVLNLRADREGNDILLSRKH
jgi:transmembrane sensor